MMGIWVWRRGGPLHSDRRHREECISGVFHSDKVERGTCRLELTRRICLRLRWGKGDYILSPREEGCEFDSS